MLQRIWKYKFHYVLVIPALLLLIRYKVAPLLRGVEMALKDYDMFQGLAASPWVGLANVQMLLSQTNFRDVLGNSVYYSLVPLVLTCLAALLLALGLHAIPSRRWRSGLTTLLLVPYVLPALVLAYILFLFFSTSSPWLMQERLWLGEPGLHRLVMTGVEIMRGLGIPVILAMAAITARRARAEREGAAEQERLGYTGLSIIPALQAMGAFALLQLSSVLATHFELFHVMTNPLVYETADTLSTYSFRTGMQNLELGLAGASWLLQFVVQLVCSIGAYLLLRRFFVPTLFASEVPADRPDRPGSPGAMLGVLLGMLAVLPVVFLLYVLFVYPFTVSSDSGLTVGQLMPAGSMLGYGLLYLGSTVVFLLMTVTLAYPLTVRRLPGRWVYKLFLLVLLVAGTMAVPEFLMYRQQQMLNTVYPIAIQGFFGLMAIFVLKSIFNSKHGARKAELEAEGRGEAHAFFTLYLPKVWKPLLALGALHWIGLWNGYAAPLMYTTEMNRFTPMLRFYQLLQGNAASELSFYDPAVLYTAALLSLPPLLLLVLLRRWLTSEVLVSEGREP